MYKLFWHRHKQPYCKLKCYFIFAASCSFLDQKVKVDAILQANMIEREIRSILDINNIYLLNKVMRRL